MFRSFIYTEQILSRAKEKGTELLLLDENRNAQFGAIDAELYAPLAAKEDNNRGIVCLFHIGEYDLLVTGDISQKMEERFLLRCLPQDVDLLSVGHHGSKYSNGEMFIDYIGADTAVISTGYNTYGHPAEETLERLIKCGYNIYRTDLDGTVIFHVEDDHGEKER